MSNTPARVPYSRVSPSKIEDVDRELTKIERQQAGMFIPTLLVAARSPYTVKSTDEIILCDTTAGNITLVFPAAARVDGLVCTVIKTVAANTVTLSGTFNGGASPTLTAQYTGKVIRAGNGVYYFTPTLSAADILPGTFPGNYVVSGTLEVDGNFSVNGTKFTASAASGNITSAGTIKERGRSTAVGEWISPAFDASIYSASTGTWTVDSGDVVGLSYTLVGLTMTLAFYFDSTTTAAGPSVNLRFKIPGGFSASQRIRVPITIKSNGGAVSSGTAQVLATSDTVFLYTALDTSASSWADGTNNNDIIGEITFPVS